MVGVLRDQNSPPAFVIKTRKQSITDGLQVLLPQEFLTAVCNVDQLLRERERTNLFSEFWSISHWNFFHPIFKSKFISSPHSATPQPGAGVCNGNHRNTWFRFVVMKPFNEPLHFHHFLFENPVWWNRIIVQAISWLWTWMNVTWMLHNPF